MKFYANLDSGNKIFGTWKNHLKVENIDKRKGFS